MLNAAYAINESEKVQPHTPTLGIRRRGVATTNGEGTSGTHWIGQMTSTNYLETHTS
jgi:hypothetical protein